jgi:tripartite-type tricarboxylate transporter receptor subunit TctC
MLGIIFRAVFAALALSTMPSLAIAQGEAPISFEGQTINLIVYSNPGGSPDIQGRLIARHMPKYLPGSPNIVVQNVPGGAGVKAITYFLEINPDTDLSFTVVSSSLPFRARSGQVTDTVFDPRKMQWIGSVSDSTQFCAFGTDVYDDLEELKNKVFTLGALDRVGPAYAVTKIVANALDWNPKIVTGYESVQTRALALERGEIDGTCTNMTSYDASFRSLVERGVGKLAFYFGPHRRGDIDAPNLLDLPMTTEKGKFTETALSSVLFEQAYALHPDADPRLLPLFRKAFKDTAEDSEFVAEAERANTLLWYTSGEEVEQDLKELYAAPESILSGIASIVNE